VVPSALPHATSTSDVYNGYYIPKGANTIYGTNQLHPTLFCRRHRSCKHLVSTMQVWFVIWLDWSKGDDA